MLCEKSESLNSFKTFKAAIELKYGTHIKCVRSEYLIEVVSFTVNMMKLAEIIGPLLDSYKNVALRHSTLC